MAALERQFQLQARTVANLLKTRIRETRNSMLSGHYQKSIARTRPHYWHLVGDRLE
jgi:hypothetical protein